MYMCSALSCGHAGANVRSTMCKDGGFDVNERRLIERLRELEKELPDGLKALIERAA